MVRTISLEPRVFLVGVGPGDPELLTFRAARVLGECDLIVHAGPGDRNGFAFDVVATSLRPDQILRGMNLAMRRGPDDGTVGYDRVAQALLDEARTGRKAAYVAEGDAMLFGTASYVLAELRRRDPDLAVEVVPGVSALSAAAARLGWPLGQKSSILTVCPATYHPDEIGAILDRPGPVCWLKVNDVLPRLVAELERTGRLEKAALVERLGRPDERIVHDLSAVKGEKLSYFSLVLVR